MRKYLITTIIAFLGIASLSAQVINKEKLREDSLYIDSMIRKMPVVRDTVRVTFLNKLSNAILRTRYSQKYRTDWAAPYAEMAYKEAKALDFTNGIIDALSNKCSLYTHLFIHNTRVKNDNSAVIKRYENAVNELLEIARKIDSPEILGTAFGAQAGFYFWTNKKNEQLKAQINSINWYKKAPVNESRECEDNLGISYTYLDLGEFEQAFEYSNRALELAKKLVKTSKNDANEISLQLSYINIAELYKIAGDYEMAISFLNESRAYHHTAKSNVTWDMAGEIGELYLESGQNDSALYYLKPLIMNRKFSYGWPQVAKAYYKLNEIDSSIKYYNLSIDSMEKRGMVAAVITGLRRSYYGKADILYQQKKYADAQKFVKKSLAMEQKRTNKMELVRTYELLSQIFYKLGKNDSAYLYLLKHNALKNSLLTRQFLFRLNNYKKQAEDVRKTSQIHLLNKNNQLKEQKLKQQAYVKNGLIIGILLLFLLGVFVFRTLLLKRKNEKLETEKTKAKLQQKVSELEMQSLRAQMNPHFIFNCLSSINRFILKNETEAASDYLTRFSRLIRMVLIHSQSQRIVLKDELEMLRLYLDMEQLRFKNSFDYNISFTNSMDPENIFIPPLLLQPFCENAIWHGLMHIEKKGYLEIKMSLQDEYLNCIISDNGIGRKKAAELKSRSGEMHKSVGLKITAERLSLMNEENNLNTSYTTKDILDGEGNIAGTKVILNIRCRDHEKETIKEPA